jgi:hypothetical protein
MSLRATATRALPGMVLLRAFTRECSERMDELPRTAPVAASMAAHRSQWLHGPPVCLPKSLPPDSRSSGSTPA